RERRGGEVEKTTSRPNGIGVARKTAGEAVTKRKGRKRSPSQSNQRAERGRSEHHRQYGHGRRACGQPTPAQPKFPARRRGEPQNGEPDAADRPRDRLAFAVALPRAGEPAAERGRSTS